MTWYKIIVDFIVLILLRYFGFMNTAILNEYLKYINGSLKTCKNNIVVFKLFNIFTQLKRSAGILINLIH